MRRFWRTPKWSFKNSTKLPLLSQLRSLRRESLNRVTPRCLKTRWGSSAGAETTVAPPTSCEWARISQTRCWWRSRKRRILKSSRKLSTFWSCKVTTRTSSPTLSTAWVRPSKQMQSRWSFHTAFRMSSTTEWDFKLSTFWKLNLSRRSKQPSKRTGLKSFTQASHSTPRTRKICWELPTTFSKRTSSQAARKT